MYPKEGAMSVFVPVILESTPEQQQALEKVSLLLNLIVALHEAHENRVPLAPGSFRIAKLGLGLSDDVQRVTDLVATARRYMKEISPALEAIQFGINDDKLARIERHHARLDIEEMFAALEESSTVGAEHAKFTAKLEARIEKGRALGLSSGYCNAAITRLNTLKG